MTAQTNIFTFDNSTQKKINWFSNSIGIYLASTNIGIIAVDSKEKKECKNIYLIDSGPDEKFALEFYEELKKEFSDFCVKAIIDTHSHADHCGANKKLSELTGCKILATHMEKSGIECTLNQSSIAYGGYPLPEYRTPFYEAVISIVDQTISSDHVFELNDDVRLECIPLPGHYFEMIGILCKEKTEGKTTTVFFTSDGIFTRSMLSRFWIPFVFDVGHFKESLLKISETKADYYVPSHGEIYTEIKTLYEFNMLSLIENEDCILECLKKSPSTHEDILKYVADKNNIPLRLSQFMLVGSTLRSYLTYLYEQERITWTFRENKMYWKIKNKSPEN